ncbi:MAG: hypothetical protein U9N81_00450 [Bacillota bacterium]|nr:hypothetical protein [Bacillota bacterium]
MQEHKIVIEVLNGAGPPSCGCEGCGGCAPGGCDSNNTNYEDATLLLKEDLNKDFGDTVEVIYVDVDKTGLDKYPIMDKVLSMGYPYPITLINGEPKFAGAIMIEEVKNVIKELPKEQ